MAYDPKASTGQNVDSISPEVLGMPFITLIQKGSAEFDESHKSHTVKKIEGCKPGSIVFAQEKLLLARPTLVIPVAQATIYSEWKSRDQGGGFVSHRDQTIRGDKAYRAGQPGSKDQYKEYLGSNEIIYTIYVMILFQVNKSWRKGMISFQATQLKHARNWLKTIANVRFKDLPDVQPPVYAATYLLDSEPASNAHGSWFSWKITLDRVLDLTNDEALLRTAEEGSVAALASLPQAEKRPALQVENAPY